MIFGKGWPVVRIIPTGYEVPLEIEIRHAGVLPTFKDKHQLENMSPINGMRTWIDLWDHAEFKVRVYLFEHSKPVRYFNLLASIENKMVWFKPHKYKLDGLTAAPWIKDANFNNVPFKCTEFRPYYLNDFNKFDILEMTFKSSRPVTIAAYDVPESIVTIIINNQICA
jgi:hypothetical protein